VLRRRRPAPLPHGIAWISIRGTGIASASTWLIAWISVGMASARLIGWVCISFTTAALFQARLVFAW
jgi:hypothetical protein